MPQLPPDSQDGNAVPFAVGSRCCVAGEGDTAAADHCTGEGQFGDADGRRGGFTVTSAHTPVIPLVMRLRGQLSGSGGRGRPAIVESCRKRVGFTPRSRGRLLVAMSADRWVPRLHPWVCVARLLDGARRYRREGPPRRETRQARRTTLAGVSGGVIFMDETSVSRVANGENTRNAGCLRRLRAPQSSRCRAVINPLCD